MKRLAVAFAATAFAASAVQGGELDAAARAFLEAQVMPWAGDATLIEAVRSQNTRTMGLSAAEIDALDKAWRAEVGTASTPTISPVVESPASAMLRDRVSGSGGIITEIIVMDAVGLNVATSGITSDYWQGDEAKHQETYGVGADAIHVGELEFDESAQEYQVQLSISLTDPESGELVGAMTIGLLADALM